MPKYSLELDRQKTLNLSIKLRYCQSRKIIFIPSSVEIKYKEHFPVSKGQLCQPTSERLTELERSIQNLRIGHNTARNYLFKLDLLSSFKETFF